MENNKDFKIENGVLLEYLGNDENVVIPDGVTEIADRAFISCQTIKNVKVPFSVEVIGKLAFAFCNNLININVPMNTEVIGDTALTFARNVIYHGDDENAPWGADFLNAYVDGDYIYLDSSKKKLLRCCSKDEEIHLPEGIKEIANNAIMSGLVKSVIVPDSVESIDEKAFQFASNVIYGGKCVGAPWGARCLNGYYKDGFVYSNSNMDKVELCTIYDKEIKIPNGVTRIGVDVFKNYEGLEKVNLPKTLVEIGKNAFYGCNNLKEINIPDSVEKIGECAFYLCTSLNVTIPDSVKEIGGFAFSYVANVNTNYPYNLLSRCENGYVDGDFIYLDSKKEVLKAVVTNKEHITIPDNVLEIGENALMDNDSIKEIEIPSHLLKIGKMAFNNCYLLEKITFPERINVMDDNIIDSCPNLVIHAPADSKAIAYAKKKGIPYEAL